MAHFLIETNSDGSIRQVLRDGIPHQEGVVLEQHFSIVTTYFKIAARNLAMMGSAESSEERRYLGLQSFVMSLTGLEAFANTYYHQRAQELDNDAMLSRIEQSHGSITRKIVELQEMSGDVPFHDQEMLIERLWQLSQLRNEIVHPRWQPAQITMPGEVWLSIEGLVENRQALFEESELCREALNWCLLLIARVARSLGISAIEGFMFHWTGQVGLTLEAVLSSLCLPNEH